MNILPDVTLLELLQIKVENENLKKELEENERKFQETDSQL